ncbi:hypothetical protein SF23_14155 [Streptomyces sp. MBRL 10]|nr:hypothetical protein SF23_14155 [Streptomyces sp. MBRL 10]
MRDEGLAEVGLRAAVPAQPGADGFEARRDLVGVELQETAVVGAEALPYLACHDQAAQLLVPVAQGQCAERDPGRGVGVAVAHPGGEVVGLLLDERGEFLGCQPERAAGAEGVGGGRVPGDGEDRGQPVEDPAVAGQLGEVEFPVLVGDHVDSGELGPAERKARSGHRPYRLLRRTSRRPSSLHAVAPGTDRATRSGARGPGQARAGPVRRARGLLPMELRTLKLTASGR